MIELMIQVDDMCIYFVVFKYKIFKKEINTN